MRSNAKFYFFKKHFYINLYKNMTKTNLEHNYNDHVEW